jgi:hypothetical protein
MVKRNLNGTFMKGTHWRTPKPWWDKDWLVAEYISKGRSAMNIAIEGKCTENNILFWLKKHSIQTRAMHDIRKAKHWGQCGADNPMWNKRGELNPNWRGGVTPERQEFYMSIAWKKACSFVWKRDHNECQRCGLKSGNGVPMHIHHIKSFADTEFRAVVGNLVLLCEVCHHFVHSRRNINAEFISEI